MTPNFNRRHFLRGTSLLGLGLAAGGLAAPHIARASTSTIRIVSNPGLENATLNAMIEQLGLFKKFGVEAEIIETPGISGPFDAIASNTADICMVSGYNKVLPRIEQGAKVKIVGAGMRKCALAVFAQPDGISTLADLKGKTVAVGPNLGLLHALMLQLLKEKGIDSSQVNFVDKGSNDQCYQAVVKREADACCSSISHFYDNDNVAVVSGGNMWEELPRCTFQTAYASDIALKDKREAMTAVLAAYGSLYDHLMSPASHDTFVQARKKAQTKFNRASAQAIWNFNQLHKPYSKDLTLTDNDIGYLQNMFIGLGNMKAIQPITAVADMSAAKLAAKLLG